MCCSLEKVQQSTLLGFVVVYDYHIGYLYLFCFFWSSTVGIGFFSLAFHMVKVVCWPFCRDVGFVFIVILLLRL